MTLPGERDSTLLPAQALLTVDEVAEACHCSAATVLRLVRERRIPFIKIGRKAPIFTHDHLGEIVKMFEHRPVTRR
jgi:excisionase family DNA binding protein